jgi:hypothetical protein
MHFDAISIRKMDIYQRAGFYAGINTIEKKGAIHYF